MNTELRTEKSRTGEAFKALAPDTRGETAPYISIVVPVLNEIGSLPQLHQELTSVLGRLQRSYEIIIIDDGSTDGSQALVQKLMQTDPHLILVQMRRRFGKATALQAGFELARGEIVFTLDADLQDNPFDIPDMLAKLDEGFDLVSGWKQNRKDPFLKRVQSKIFNWITSRVTGLKMRDFNCGFKVYRREVTHELSLYGELYRFIPALAHALGFRVGELSVNHRARVHGRSKYSYERIIRAPFDLFTTLYLVAFRRRPAHLLGPIGVVLGLVGVLINAYLAVRWFQGYGIGDRPLLMLGTLLMILGVQIVIFGLLAEMIVSTTYERKHVFGLIRRIDHHKGRQEINAA
jgi:glycosyltransferase involved in cell wall biosynthesis